MAHHDHGHDHRSHATRNRRRLAGALAIAAAYMLAELAGGLWTRSLALLADAGHMLSDVVALALSFVAMWLADRPAPAHRTYGYYRAEILAALANGVALAAISILIIVEAIERMDSPPPVLGGPMLAIALGGLGVNILGLVLLHGGKDESLNVRGAWLHVFTDALGSVGAILAGLSIYFFQWIWADAVASVLIAILVLYSGWRLIEEAVSVLMESAPRGVDVSAIQAALARRPGVLEVHDLHVWTITSGLPALSVHVVTDTATYATILQDVRATLHREFGIDHVTVQVEPQEFDERVCPF
jgi:cobalt-zinc-cadmium efflux system protein